MSDINIGNQQDELTAEDESRRPKPERLKRAFNSRVGRVAFAGLLTAGMMNYDKVPIIGDVADVAPNLKDKSGQVIDSGVDATRSVIYAGMDMLPDTPADGIVSNGIDAVKNARRDVHESAKKIVDDLFGPEAINSTTDAGHLGTDSIQQELGVYTTFQDGAKPIITERP